MTNYCWINYNEKNIYELYEQDEKITQQELKDEKQQEQMNQTQIRAQDLYNEIITMNPNFNKEAIYAHSVMTLTPGKRINRYMLYQKVLHNWFLICT